MDMVLLVGCMRKAGSECERTLAAEVSRYCVMSTKIGPRNLNSSSVGTEWERKSWSAEPEEFLLAGDVAAREANKGYISSPTAV